MKRASLERLLERLWYGKSRLYRLLLPLSWLYCGVSQLRRSAYRHGVFSSTKPPCTVIVAGNIVAGGSGKTSLVIALSECLKDAGFRVGILCSGYRGRARQWPQLISADSDPDTVGDEAVLLARRTGLPVVAGRDRVAAAAALLQSSDCDVLISDDGLQHYRLQRDLEIVALDAGSAFGNGACLPAGPLREAPSRLRSVAAVVGVGGPATATTATAEITGDVAGRLDSGNELRPLAEFAGQEVHAVAGIARPERFFSRLEAAGLKLQRHDFGDHHRFTADDLPVADGRPILMTEKDAVKCQAFSRPDCWYVQIELRLDTAFVDWVVGRVSQKES